MTLTRPDAALLLEGGGPALGTGPLSAAQAALRRVLVDLSVDEAHDRVEVWAWPGSPLAGAAAGARLTVGLGTVGDTEDVLTVEVAGVDATGGGSVLTGYAPSRRLASTYVGRSYVDRSVGDVVSDLLGEAGVDEGDVDASLSLPVLHVDPRRSAWATLHALAGRVGCQVTTGSDGAVSFTPIPGAAGGGLGGGLAGAAGALAAAVGLGSTQELREGAELVGFRVGPRTPLPTLDVLSPVGTSATLLLAEPDSGAVPPVQVDVALRTTEAADGATTARQAAARRRGRSAVLTVPGRASLRAGATVKARGEDWRVLRVRHLLDADAGYRCELTLEGDR